MKMETRNRQKEKTWEDFMNEQEKGLIELINKEYPHYKNHYPPNTDLGCLRNYQSSD